MSGQLLFRNIWIQNQHHQQLFYTALLSQQYQASNIEGTPKVFRNSFVAPEMMGGSSPNLGIPCIWAAGTASAFHMRCQTQGQLDNILRNQCLG